MNIDGGDEYGMAVNASMLANFKPVGVAHVVVDVLPDGLCFMTSLFGSIKSTLPVQYSVKWPVNGGPQHKFGSMRDHYNHAHDWIAYFLRACEAGIKFAKEGSNYGSVDFPGEVLTHLSTADIGEPTDALPIVLWTRRLKKLEALRTSLYTARMYDKFTSRGSAEWRGSWIDCVLVAHRLQRRVVVVSPTTDGDYNAVTVYTSKRRRQSAAAAQYAISVHKPVLQDITKAVINPTEDVVLMWHQKCHYKRILPSF